MTPLLTNFFNYNIFTSKSNVLLYFIEAALISIYTHRKKMV